ncbi:hypothetical protein ADL02_33175 [Streptomyces sp. NRRL WC-3723]|nr:hypothetical protein ADL02_33175 [Streptomyces sp. NRRL WC-3723]
MPAGGAVEASAGSELDLAAVEVLLEPGPLVRGGVSVFVGGTDLAPVFEVLLVVADDVFVEHRDAAASGLDVQMPEQGRADVDRQAAVEECGDEDPAEVVWGELQPLEGVHFSEGADRRWSAEAGWQPSRRGGHRDRHRAASVVRMERGEAADH